ncbi:MAG: hypothetical protein COA78_30045 [Blastopirellula sp.]|nr:MAG: hypothetical protein COA78_30045 [Blastopirellula sp.]
MKQITRSSFALFLIFLLGCGSQTSTDGETDNTPTSTNNSNQIDVQAISNDKNKSSDNPVELEVVQEDVQKMELAIFAEDADALLEYAHPIVMKLSGNDTKVFYAALEKTFSIHREKSAKLESLSFIHPPTYVQSDINEFAIVPVKKIVKTSDRRVENLPIYVGIRPIGSSEWKYIDITHVSHQIFKAIFPDFPADQELPKTYVKDL